MSRAIWLKLDEPREALLALEILHAQLARAATDPIAWKWALVALHQVLQDLVVASLERPTLMGAMQPLARRTAPAHRDAGVTTVVPDVFLELYARVQEDTGLVFGVEVDVAVARLHEHRNGFLHFTPAGWNVHVNDLPGIARESLRAVRALGWDPGHVAWPEETMWQEAADRVEACEELLDRLEENYRA